MMLNYKQISFKTTVLEFHDIEPTLKNLLVPLQLLFLLAYSVANGISPHESANGSATYTVPAVNVLSRGVLRMDSTRIAHYLEFMYPSPPLPLTPNLGTEVETKSRAQLAVLSFVSVAPREVRILSSEAQAYFHRTREARMGGRKLEFLLEGEDEAWRNAEGGLREVGSLLLTNEAHGPFLLGEQGVICRYLHSRKFAVRTRDGRRTIKAIL